jgi:protein-tyrosine phosphatase
MNVLFVCTGNICRSPLAEQVFDQMVAASGFGERVKVDSSGTFGLSGSEMDLGSMRAMRDLGFDPKPHRAKALTREQAEWADLILTFSEAHRADVVELHVPANRYAFTLTEFANLVTHYESPEAELASRLTDTLRHRGVAPRLDDLDIADPYGLDRTAFASMADQTHTALKQVMAWLR